MNAMQSKQTADDYCCDPRDRIFELIRLKSVNAANFARLRVLRKKTHICCLHFRRCKFPYFKRYRRRYVSRNIRQNPVEFGQTVAIVVRLKSASVARNRTTAYELAPNKERVLNTDQKLQILKIKLQ